MANNKTQIVFFICEDTGCIHEGPCMKNLFIFYYSISLCLFLYFSLSLSFHFSRSLFLFLSCSLSQQTSVFVFLFLLSTSTVMEAVESGIYCTCDGSCGIGHVPGRCGRKRYGNGFQCAQPDCPKDETCKHSSRTTCNPCRNSRAYQKVHCASRVVLMFVREG